MSEVQTPVPLIEWGEARRAELDDTRSPFTAAFSGEYLTVLFDELAADLQDGPAVSRTRCLSLEVPVKVNRAADFVGYLTDLRGFVSKTDGARVVLVADLGGAVRVHEFPYGPLAVNDGVAVPLPGGEPPPASAGPGSTAELYRSAFSLERRPPRETNLPYSPVPPFLATLLLVVQRRTADDFGTLQVDSLGVTAVFNAALARRPARPAPARRVRALSI
jgi:hypothetical protein